MAAAAAAAAPAAAGVGTRRWCDDGGWFVDVGCTGVDGTELVGADIDPAAAGLRVGLLLPPAQPLLPPPP